MVGYIHFLIFIFLKNILVSSSSLNFFYFFHLTFFISFIYNNYTQIDSSSSSSSSLSLSRDLFSTFNTYTHTHMHAYTYPTYICTYFISLRNQMQSLRHHRHHHLHHLDHRLILRYLVFPHMLLIALLRRHCILILHRIYYLGNHVDLLI